MSDARRQAVNPAGASRGQPPGAEPPERGDSTFPFGTTTDGPAVRGDPLQRARITALTSGKGGVGKTFVSANLAAALAARGERVLVLDADLGLANLDVVLNLTPKVTLHDVFTGKHTLDEALIEVDGGFTVLLAGSGMVEYSRLTPEVRDKLIDTLNVVAPRYDRVLLDTGAGISDVVLYTVSLADEVVVVVTPEPTSMTDAYATIKVLASTQGRRLIRVVVNQRVPGVDGRNVAAQLQQVVDRYVSPGLDAPLTLELIGDVPADASVRDAVRRRQLVSECFPGSPAALALAAVADKLGHART
jgi:flagellar biosynthesis protein FlhG